MRSLEDMKREHAASAAKLAAELAFAERLPAVPDAVQINRSLETWATYRKRSIADALDLFRLFTIVPAVHAVGTFGHLAPESLIRERNGFTVKAGPIAAVLTVSTAGQFGPSASLFWFARIGDDVARIIVQLEGPGYIGTFPGWAAAPVEQRDGRGRVIARHYAANNALAALADGVVTFASGASGPIADSADHRYYFMGDGQAEAPGGEHAHAIDQIALCADATRGEGC